MSYIQKLIDAQNDIIIICDKDFKIKHINKVFFEFFKKDRIDEIINTLKSQKFDKKFKLKIKNYKSHKYTFLAKISKIDNDISITLKDITKSSAYEKSLLQSNINFVEYKNIIDKFLIVSKTDINGNITYVNDLFVKISGYSKEELLNKPHNIVKHPDMPSYIFSKMWKTIKSGNIWQGVIKNRKKNGDFYYVKTLIAPLFNSKNKIKEYIALRVDITDLIKAKEAAQKAKKTKEMFLANMSHEIRTPLTGIIGFIEILQQKILPKEIKEIIDTISNSADTLLNIVNDVLNLSKIETEGVIIHKDNFNPTTSFINTINLFKARALEKNINYIYDVNITDCVISDEHRLKQILANLIGNAIKFTPENGEVKISIKTKEENENSVIVDFSVEDSGIGIAQNKLQTLFKPFSQIEGTEETYGGSGLGLYISAQIIEKLGGKLQVKSEEGKGSKFYFRLEFRKCKKITKIENKNVSLVGKILVAEDNKVNQELIKAILKTKGNIKTIIVNNGEEAVNKFKEEKFDLVLMDVFMPIMRGIEATQLILEYEKNNNLKHTPIVVLTANALDGDKEKFLKQGFDDYIAKPIKNAELDNVLIKYLKNGNIVSNLAKEMNLDESVIQELLNIYFENIDNDLKSLEKAIKENNYSDIRTISHKIAGASGAVQFLDAHKIAKDIENFAKDEKDVNYQQLFGKLYEEINSHKQKI